MEQSEVFFSVTKLFQNKDVNLRRMVRTAAHPSGVLLPYVSKPKNAFSGIHRQSTVRHDHLCFHDHDCLSYHLVPPVLDREHLWWTGHTKLRDDVARQVYLIIKDVCPREDEAIIIMSSLMKDMNSKTDLYRSNAIRVLCSICGQDTQLLVQIERYLKQAIVDKVWQWLQLVMSCVSETICIC